MTNFFISGLTILFIGLKLTGIINWSWWWVLASFWVPLLIGLISLFAYAGIKAYKPKKKTKSTNCVGP